MPASASTLRKHVEQIAGSPRVPGTPTHAKAAAYIREQLEAASFNVRAMPFLDPDGINIIGEAGPPTGPILVIGAHYDSVPGSPGADDNASAVAALLELARLVGHPDKLRLQLVAYDREEDGLIGSRKHVRALQRDGHKPLAMISLEMLGFKGGNQVFPEGIKIAPISAEVVRTTGDFLAIVANQKSSWLLEEFQFGAGSAALPIMNAVVKADSEAAQLARLSDHGSFWEAGWSALLVTDTAFLRNPHYHQSTDTPATLDYEFLRESTDAVFRAVTRLF